MVLAGLYLAHSSQHKMKSVLLPVSVKKMNIIRTELAIWYPIKTWPWSSGTGFPTAQAATDSTPEEITMAEGLSCEIYFLAWGHQMFGSRYANVTICVRINIPSKQQAHMHAHTLSLPQLLYSKWNYPHKWEVPGLGTRLLDGVYGGWYGKFIIVCPILIVNLPNQQLKVFCARELIVWIAAGFEWKNVTSKALDHIIIINTNNNSPTPVPRTWSG